MTTFVQIAHTWSLDLEQLDGAGIEDFFKLLTRKIDQLWNDNPDKLMNTLYRLDVDEARVAAAIKSPKSGSIPQDLAQLIIERELQKAVTRGKAPGTF